MVHDERYYVKRLKKGDGKAFEFLFDKYKKRLYLFSLRFLKSEHLAEEFTQETFLKVWEKRKQLNEDESFNSYIHTICKNDILNYLKRSVKLQHIKKEILNKFSYSGYDTDDIISFNEFNDIFKDRRPDIYL